MKNIGILTGSKSESHLTSVVNLELSNLEYNVFDIKLSVNSIIGSYILTEKAINLNCLNFVLAVGDRTEQIGGVLAAYQNKIPIGHLYAGDLNSFTTFDDIHRHIITLYSDIQMCSSGNSVFNVINLKKSINSNPKVYLVGATHFDYLKKNNLYKDINISLPFTANKQYSVILLNSETKGNNTNLINELDICLTSCITDNFVIVKSNEDDFLELQVEYILKKHNLNILLAPIRFKHKDFLSLIANCEHFITNSSSAIYEAPQLLKPHQIINIGNRNKDRTPVKTIAHTGNASLRVAMAIDKYLKETKEVN